MSTGDWVLVGLRFSGLCSNLPQAAPCVIPVPSRTMESEDADGFRADDVSGSRHHSFSGDACYGEDEHGE